MILTFLSNPEQQNKAIQSLKCTEKLVHDFEKKANVQMIFQLLFVPSLRLRMVPSDLDKTVMFILMLSLSVVTRISVLSVKNAPSV